MSCAPSDSSFAAASIQSTASSGMQRPDEPSSNAHHASAAAGPPMVAISSTICAGTASPLFAINHCRDSGRNRGHHASITMPQSVSCVAGMSRALVQADTDDVRSPLVRALPAARTRRAHTPREARTAWCRSDLGTERLSTRSARPHGLAADRIGCPSRRGPPGLSCCSHVAGAAGQGPRERAARSGACSTPCTWRWSPRTCPARSSTATALRRSSTGTGARTCWGPTSRTCWSAPRRRPRARRSWRRCSPGGRGPGRSRSGVQGTAPWRCGSPTPRCGTRGRSSASSAWPRTSPPCRRPWPGRSSCARRWPAWPRSRSRWVLP